MPSASTCTLAAVPIKQQKRILPKEIKSIKQNPSPLCIKHSPTSVATVSISSIAVSQQIQSSVSSSKINSPPAVVTSHASNLLLSLLSKPSGSSIELSSSCIKSSGSTQELVKQPDLVQALEEESDLHGNLSDSSTYDSNQVPSQEVMSSSYLLTESPESRNLSDLPCVPDPVQAIEVPDSSPPRNYNEPSDIWLSNHLLTLTDKSILQSNSWLNDKLINAAQRILKKDINKILGWQATQCCMKLSKFCIVPHTAPFIQILHANENHWVTVSNVNVHGGSLTNTVYVYDSKKIFSVSNSLIDMVCSFFKPPTSPLHFDIINMQTQENNDDCGLFAIASATELAYGKDPCTCDWDCFKMRQHLLNCLEANSISPFPTKGKRLVRFGCRIRNPGQKTEIYCVCRMPHDSKQAMIRCSYCTIWYHKDCMKLNEQQCRGKWKCPPCKDNIKQLHVSS